MRGHRARPFASRCAILDFFRFKNKNFSYRSYSVIDVISYCVCFTINVIFTISFTLLCLPSRFHKKFFPIKLLFSLGTIHLFHPLGRGVVRGDLKLVTCLWILLSLNNRSIVLFCRRREVFHKIGGFLWTSYMYLSACMYVSIFFTNYRITSSLGVKSQKHWWALYDK